MTEMSGFKLCGDRRWMRSDEEMLAVDKAAADSAFKAYKKSVLDPAMKEMGFCKYKTSAYVRRNSIDVLEYVELQKEHYGSKTFTVNVAVLPLYLPHSYISFSFSSRLGRLICNRDVWWDFADEAAAKTSFENVAHAIGQFAAPWFMQYEDEDFLIGQIREEKRVREERGLNTSYKNDSWLSALEHPTDRAQTIAENIEKLNLPKKLLNRLSGE